MGQLSSKETIDPEELCIRDDGPEEACQTLTTSSEETLDPEGVSFVMVGRRPIQILEVTIVLAKVVVGIPSLHLKLSLL
ncbi:hypothetical protein AVEN_237738-1 [Araneus ventricosus]|uniref:Uncharacterized protein n=1 Tax=Araneus ventricosus TaxID=182803 RepID=A0A4Y2VGC9_ARAVE|nr:hypothetical protein AVEN_237738-1 [Araneus ventricosus]